MYKNLVCKYEIFRYILNGKVGSKQQPLKRLLFDLSSRIGKQHQQLDPKH